MVEFKLFNERVKTKQGDLIPVMEFRLNSKVNALVGNSGTGKELIYERLRNTEREFLIDGWSYTCNKVVEAVRNINSIEEIVNWYKDTLLILDETITYCILQRDWLYECVYNSSNYFLFMDNGIFSKIDIPKDSIFQLEEKRPINKVRMFDVIRATNFDMNIQL